jgi:hypothetical protein
VGVIEKSTRKKIGTIELRPPATEKRMDGLEIGFGMKLVGETTYVSPVDGGKVK